MPIPVPMAFHAFGGWKASRFGDHPMHGAEGTALQRGRLYTRLEAITTRWLRGLWRDPKLVMPTMGQ